MCDGCCCGTQEKHPTIDHAGQRAALTEAALNGGGTARSVDCLGECHASNVAVVLYPGRPADWLGWIVDDQITGDICDWLEKGAPSPLPALIAPHIIERDQTARA